MHQFSSPANSPPRVPGRGPSPVLRQLAAERQRNQQEIDRLQRRNRALNAQIKQVRRVRAAHLSPVTSVTPIGSRRRSAAPWVQNLQRRGQQMGQIRLGRYSLEFWLQAALLAFGIAIVCGSLSFMVTRLVATLLGG